MTRKAAQNIYNEGSTFIVEQTVKQDEENQFKLTYDSILLEITDETIDGRPVYNLANELSVEYKGPGIDATVVIPKGFKTDLASIPSFTRVFKILFTTVLVIGIIFTMTAMIFGPIVPLIVALIPIAIILGVAAVLGGISAAFPPGGKHSTAAVVHDYLYKTGANRQLGDMVFRELMRASTVPRWRLGAMYFAVRVFGGRHAYKRLDQNGINDIL